MDLLHLFSIFIVAGRLGLSPAVRRETRKWSKSFRRGLRRRRVLQSADEDLRRRRGYRLRPGVYRRGQCPENERPELCEDRERRRSRVRSASLMHSHHRKLRSSRS